MNRYAEAEVFTPKTVRSQVLKVPRCCRVMRLIKIIWFKKQELFDVFRLYLRTVTNTATQLQHSLFRDTAVSKGYMDEMAPRVWVENPQTFISFHNQIIFLCFLSTDHRIIYGGWVLGKSSPPPWTTLSCYCEIWHPEYIQVRRFRWGPTRSPPSNFISHYCVRKGASFHKPVLMTRVKYRSWRGRFFCICMV